MHIFRRETIGEITVITLEIRAMDAANAADVTADLLEAMKNSAKTVLDLGALRYFDVSGFAGILKCVAGGPGEREVRLCSRSGNIRALLELLQADTIVPLYQSREEAMASFQAAGLSPAQRRRAIHREEDSIPTRRTA
jgi:anti-anti-sigma factor